MNVLFWGPDNFPVSYSKGIPRGILKSSFRKFLLSIRRSYSAIWSPPLANIKWHSDLCQVTMTSQPIRLSTNFMTLMPSLTFTDLRMVSMKYLQRMWHASRERLPFWTPCSAPPFLGTCLLSNGCDHCRVVSRHLTLNTLRYFLEFAYVQI